MNFYFNAETKAKITTEVVKELENRLHQSNRENSTCMLRNVYSEVQLIKNILRDGSFSTNSDDIDDYNQTMNDLSVILNDTYLILHINSLNGEFIKTYFNGKLVSDKVAQVTYIETLKDIAIKDGDWCFDESVGLVQVKKIVTPEYVDVFAPFHPMKFWCLKLSDLELFNGKLPSCLTNSI